MYWDSEIELRLRNANRLQKLADGFDEGLRVLQINDPSWKEYLAIIKARLSVNSGMRPEEVIGVVKKAVNELSAEERNSRSYDSLTDGGVSFLIELPNWPSKVSSLGDVIEFRSVNGMTIGNRGTPGDLNSICVFK